MKFRRRTLGRLGCALTLAPLRVDAQPSIWVKARNHRAINEDHLLRSFERFLLGEARARDETFVHQAIVDYLSGQPYQDPRLEFLAAKVRFEAMHVAEQRVIERLTRVVKEAYESPLAAEGALDLAHMLAQIGRPREAMTWYERALQRLWQPDQRAAALSARGQVHMYLGATDRAVLDCQQAARSAHSAKQRALSYFFLGVALERNGNLAQALNEVRRAQSIRVRSTAFSARSALDLPGVFFLPDFDRFYMLGLSQLALGTQETDVNEARTHLDAALVFFEEYLKQAERVRDRYLGNGRRLLRYAKDALARLPTE